MPNPRISPETRLDLDFIVTTVKWPQNPIGGVAVVGEAATRFFQQGILEPSTFANDRLNGGDRQRHIVAATMAVHQLLGVDRNAGLNAAVPFAHDLVRSGIISTAVEFSEGTDGRSLGLIERASGSLVERFVFMAENDALFLDGVHTYSQAAAGVFMAPGGEAQQHAEQYQSDILKITTQYEGDARMAEMNAARQGLSDAVRPLVAEAVSQVLPDAYVDATIANLMRWEPGMSLVNEYFAPPQQG
jgi:hypothetical protein